MPPSGQINFLRSGGFMEGGRSGLSSLAIFNFSFSSLYDLFAPLTYTLFYSFTFLLFFKDQTENKDHIGGTESTRRLLLICQNRPRQQAY